MNEYDEIETAGMTVLEVEPQRLRDDILTLCMALCAQAVRRGWESQAVNLWGLMTDTLALPAVKVEQTYAVPVTAWAQVTFQRDGAYDVFAQARANFDRYSVTPYGTPSLDDSDGRAPQHLGESVTLPSRDEWRAWAERVEWTALDGDQIRTGFGVSVLELAGPLGESESWCDEYETACEHINARLSVPVLIPREELERDYEVTVTEYVTRTYSVTVTASDEEDAADIARQEYADRDNYPSEDVSEVTVDEVYES